jgi:outer membrane murein-binding lipoprotein Lpp
MEPIISAIIASGLSLIGVILTNANSNKKIEQQLLTSQAVTEAKIQQLTDEVRKHNCFADRITKLEVKVEALEKEVKKP